MWLGVIAVIIAISFALIKFLTGVHWRRLRENQVRLQGELNKHRQRLQALDGTLQVARGHKGAIEQKLKLGRRFKDELYERLRLELPGPLVSEARNCINHNPIPQPRGVRLFHELKIADKIAKTLQSMAVGLFEFSIADDEARTTMMDTFIEMLGASEVSHIRGQAGSEDTSASLLEEHVIVCAFDQATTCMELTRAFIQKAGGDLVGQVRAVLLAGVNTSRHADDDVSRLFARALDHALDFIPRSPQGSLLMNLAAREHLGDASEGVELFDKAQQLYVFAWQALEGEAVAAEASTPANTGSAVEEVTENTDEATPDDTQGSEPESEEAPQSEERKP